MQKFNKKKSAENYKGDTTRIRTWTFNMPYISGLLCGNPKWTTCSTGSMDGQMPELKSIRPSEFSLIHLPFTWKKGPCWIFYTYTHTLLFINSCEAFAVLHPVCACVCVCLHYVYILALVDLNSGKKGRTSSHRKSRHIWMEAQAIDLLYSIENICANGMHGTVQPQYTVFACWVRA